MIHIFSFESVPKLEEEVVKSFIKVIIYINAFGCPVGWLVYLWVVVGVVWRLTHIVFDVCITSEAGNYSFDIFCYCVFVGDELKAKAKEVL